LHTNKPKPSADQTTNVFQHVAQEPEDLQAKLSTAVPLLQLSQTNALTTVHYFALLEQNEINDNNNHRRRGWFGQKSELNEHCCIVFGTSLGEEEVSCSVQDRSIGPSVGGCSARRALHPRSQPKTGILATAVRVTASLCFGTFQL
jgi:hypothetical protein